MNEERKKEKRNGQPARIASQNDAGGHPTSNIQRPIFKKLLWLITLAFTFVIATSTISHARVFWRWNATVESDSTMKSLGGKTAYSAPIKLNGGNGTITVHSFNEDIATVTKTLRRAFNTKGLQVENGSMATATITDNGMVINLIAISMQAYGPTTVFKFSQTTEDAARSKNPPQNPIKEIPQFPNAKTSFYAKDEKTKTALAVSSAPTTVQSVLSFYLSELPADGWSAPLSSPNNPHPTGQMMLYQKNNQLCCIFAAPNPNTQQTNITVLHKTLSNGDF